MTPPDQSTALTRMAVKLVQLYLTALTSGSGKKIGTLPYHRACYEVFPLMELEIVPRMVFENVTRSQFFAECHAQGFYGLADLFETEFAAELLKLPPSVRWHQAS